MFVTITDKQHKEVNDMVVNIGNIEAIYPKKVESLVNPETGETEETPVLIGVTYWMKLKDDATEYRLTTPEYNLIVAKVEEYNALHLNELKCLSEELKDTIADNIPKPKEDNGTVVVDIKLKYDDRYYPVAIKLDDIMSMNANIFMKEYTITVKSDVKSPFVSSLKGLQELLLDNPADFYDILDKLKERRR